jgi:hypothetical protein
MLRRSNIVKALHPKRSQTPVIPLGTTRKTPSQARYPKNMRTANEFPHFACSVTLKR